MMRLSMKACLPLLCGISVLFSVEGESNKTATAAPSMLLTSAHNESEPLGTTWDHSATHGPTEVAATAHATESHTAETEEAVVRSSNSSRAGLVVVSTAAAVTRSSGPAMLRTPTEMTTARPAGDAQPPRDTTISETSKPTKDKRQRGSSTTSTDGGTPVTTSAASSTSQPLTSAITLEVTSSVSPSNTSTVSSPSSSTVTVTNPATEVSPASDPTSLPVMTTKTLTTGSSNISPTSQPVSDRVSSSQFPDTAGSSSPTESSTATVSDSSSISTSAVSDSSSISTSAVSDSSSISTSAVSDSSSISTSAVSTSPAGIFPKRLPSPSTTPTPSATAAPCKVSKVPLITPEVQPCSTRGVVNHCLIAIASLAALATIFMVTTVVLCSKLSSRRYKVRRPQQSTEMMCISALLPEEEFTYTRHRTPIANGVLVIPSGRDSDDEGGDNVTLSSFLPDNERYV